jgi:hypothetical protein
LAEGRGVQFEPECILLIAATNGALNLPSEVKRTRRLAKIDLLSSFQIVRRVTILAGFRLGDCKYTFVEPVLPAASVTLAVKLWLPVESGAAGVKFQPPPALARDVPRSSSPS